MSYEIIKKIKADNGKIIVEQATNNIIPHEYKRRELVDTPETREMIKKFFIDRAWQPWGAVKNSNFVKSLNIEVCFDGRYF